jgi:hypothetical protein
MPLTLEHFNVAVDIQRQLTPDNANLFARALPDANGNFDFPAIAELGFKAYDDGSPAMLDAIEFVQATVELLASPTLP